MNLSYFRIHEGNLFCGFVVTRNCSTIYDKCVIPLIDDLSHNLIKIWLERNINIRINKIIGIGIIIS